MMGKQHIEEVLQIIEEAMLKIKICIGRQNGKSNLQYKINRAYLAIPELLKELIAYKDAEEQGLLYRLPCKIGDIVFAIVEECEDFYIPDSNYYTIYPERFALYMIEEIGKSVFLTEPEAEAALKALKEYKQ